MSDCVKCGLPLYKCSGHAEQSAGEFSDLSGLQQVYGDLVERLQNACDTLKIATDSSDGTVQIGKFVVGEFRGMMSEAIAALQQQPGQVQISRECADEIHNALQEMRDGCQCFNTRSEGKAFEELQQALARAEGEG